MTKRSMLLSLASGKLGDMVFYRAGGEQRTRTRVIPKNPKTIAQMNQRLRMLNPSAIYRSLSPILSASFTARKSNQSSANKFMSEAMSTLPYYITKSMKDELLCVPFGAMLSSGSLGVRVEGQTKNVYPQQGGDSIQAMTYDCLFRAYSVSGDAGPDTYSSEIAGLPGALSQSDSNASFLRDSLLVSVPDKFTLSVVAAAPVLIDEENSFYAWRLGVRTYSIEGDTLSVSYRGCPEADNYAHLHAVYSLSTGTQMTITVGAASNDGVEVAQHPTAVILSFEEEGELKITTSFVSSVGATGATAKRNFVRFFKEGGDVYVQAMNEYGYTTGSALNSQVLNTTQESEADAPSEEEGGEDLTS